MQLAKAIVSYTQPDNFTISLCGKWGSGKTSILNMVEEYIIENTNKLSDKNKPIIIHFNPWNYSDKGQLITQFFSALLSELKTESKNKDLKRVGDALQEYSSILDYAEYIPIAGKYFKPIKWIIDKSGKRISKHVDEKSNLENKKQEVTKALLEQSRKFIVIIDDIDRLNNEQIKLIFQLVNSLAGFPNIIYLLAFDREVVVRALCEEQNCNGEEYLEKIIQVPFNIPEVKGELVNKVFFDKLNQLWNGDNPCSNFEEKYWYNVFNYCISPFIKSIRDVNRIFNVYQFKYLMMHNETNCMDLLAITTIQICAPKIYEWIYNNINNLCGSVYTKGVSGVEQTEARNKRIEEFKKIYPDSELMLQIVQTLFPKFSWLTGGYYHSSDTDDELRRKQKIACRTRSNLYFNLSLEDVVISKKEILETINDYDKVKLSKYLDDLIDNNKILEYSKELLSYITDIPQNKKRMFLEELIRILTIPLIHESKGLFVPYPATFITHCIWKIFKTFSQEESGDELTYLLNNLSINDFSVVIHLILKIENSYGRIGQDIDCDFRIVTEEQLDKLEKIVINRLVLFSKKYNIFDLFFLNSTYIFWKNVDKESLNKYIIEAIIAPINIPKFLKTVVNHWTGRNNSGWTFDENSFDEYMTDKYAYDMIQSLKSTYDFSLLDDYSKKLAIAYYLWYERKGEKLSRVSESEVENIIDEWEYRL